MAPVDGRPLRIWRPYRRIGHHYGLIFLALGLVFGSGFDHIARAFPLPILGVLLLFEALSLIWLIRDTADSRLDFPIAALVGLIAVGLPYGYLIGMVAGTILCGWVRG